MQGWSRLTPEGCLGPRYRPPKAPPAPHTEVLTPLRTLTAENMEYIQSHQTPIDQPTQNRLLLLSSSLETVQAKRAVSDKENQEFRDLVRPPKRPRAGITVGNMGQHHFTDATVYQRVVEADKAVEETRKRAKGKQKAREDSPQPVYQDQRLKQWILGQL